MKCYIKAQLIYSPQKSDPIISYDRFGVSVKPAAHESYLLSKNSLVTIGVSKLPQCAATF